MNRSKERISRARAHRQAFRGTWLLLVLIGSVSMSTAEDWEQPQNRSAKDILPAEMLAGEHFAVAAEVQTDGFVYFFDLTTDFGEIPADSIWELQIRVGEIEALGELAKVSTRGAVAQTAGDIAMAPVDAATDLVTSPIKTTKNMARGISSLFKSRKRQIASVTAKKKAQEAETEGEGEGEGEQEPVSEEDKRAKVDKALGTARQVRLWAYKKHVDPYSDSEVLRAELHRVGKVTALAGGTVNIRAFDHVENGGLPYINRDVYLLPQPDLRARNEEVLTQAGFTSENFEAYDALFDNPMISPTMRTIVLDSFAALEGVEGRENLVAMLAAMETIDEARFQVGHAEFLAAFHEEKAPLEEIWGGPVLPAAITTTGEVFIPFAADYLLWTEDLASALGNRVASLREATGDRMIDVYLAGEASARTIEGLADLGIAIQPMKYERR